MYILGSAVAVKPSMLPPVTATSLLLKLLLMLHRLKLSLMLRRLKLPLMLRRLKLFLTLTLDLNLMLILI